MIKAVVIDDEQLAIDVLKVLLDRHEDVDVVGTYTDPEIALKDIDSKVDVVFLDLEMGTLHGIEFARKIKEIYPHIAIICVTAHARFAIDAFEIRALDYLLKPVNPERLTQTLAQVRENKHYLMERTREEKKLRVEMMGSFNLLDFKGEKVKWRTRKVKELFAYFWHHDPNPVHRSRIIEDLWPDYPRDRAIALMHTSLYQLRKAIGELGLENPVKLVNEQYSFHLELDSDVEKLEEVLVGSAQKQANPETILHLYKGDYLEEENYQWAFARQREIKGTFLNYLKSYVQSELENEQPIYLVELCLEKMIELEPYNEHFVYLLIDYYGKIKDTRKMITVVEKFKKMWTEELGIDIPEEVYKKYNRYLACP